MRSAAAAAADAVDAAQRAFATWPRLSPYQRAVLERAPALTAARSRLAFGMVRADGWLPATPESPFGGVTGSGLGRETGAEGLLVYMERKAVFTGNVR